MNCLFQFYKLIFMIACHLCDFQPCDVHCGGLKYVEIPELTLGKSLVFWYGLIYQPLCG